LKPWTEGYSPFGAKIRPTVYLSAALGFPGTVGLTGLQFSANAVRAIGIKSSPGNVTCIQQPIKGVGNGGENYHSGDLGYSALLVREL
jgi:hypothetical protein